MCLTQLRLFVVAKWYSSKNKFVNFPCPSFWSAKTHLPAQESSESTGAADGHKAGSSWNQSWEVPLWDCILQSCKPFDRKGKVAVRSGSYLFHVILLYLSDFVVCTSNSFLGSSTRKQRCLCPRSLTQFAFGQFLTPTSGLQLSLIVWQPALVPAGFISDWNDGSGTYQLHSLELGALKQSGS